MNVSLFTCGGRIEQLDESRHYDERQGDTTVKQAYLSAKFFIVVISLFLSMLFVLPVSAVKEWRESNFEGGWQIWISAVDFDKVENLKTGEQEKKLAGNAQKPWLAKDILIAKAANGLADYTFESPVAGKAYIWCRVADFRGGGQSWFIVLNSENHEGDGLVIDTHGPVWRWSHGRDKPESESPTDLKKGTNTARIQPREAAAGLEPLFDVFMISNEPFEPTDEDYEKAKESLPVAPAVKLATTWGAIKHRF